MTCREKLAIEHPQYVSDEYEGGCWGCPNYYGYLKRPDYCSNNSSHCYSCWNREIPGTEKIEKEKKTMVKTKNELMEEINAKTREIADLKDEVQKLEKYRKYDEMADELGAVRASFIKAGFTDDQAYDLIKTFVGGFIGRF